MRQFSLLLILFLTVTAVNAQGYYFNIGQNFTKYDYKNSLGQRNSNIKSDNGIMADFGYQWNNSRQHLSGLPY